MHSVNTSSQALPSQANDLVQGSSALKKHGTPENLWTLNTLQLPWSLGMLDKRHVEISSDVGMSTRSPLLPVEEGIEVSTSIVSKEHQGLSILSSLSEGTMESNEVLPSETKGWSLAPKATELTTNGKWNQHSLKFSSIRLLLIEWIGLSIVPLMRR